MGRDKVTRTEAGKTASVSHPRQVPPRSCPRGLAGRSGGAHHCPAPLPQNQGGTPRTQDNLPRKEILMTEVTTESLLCPRTHGDPCTGPSPTLQPGRAPTTPSHRFPAPAHWLAAPRPPHRALAPPRRGHCSSPPRDYPEAFLVPHGPSVSRRPEGLGHEGPWGSRILSSL